jgi:DNA-binding IclR family transcriptional regulator
VLDHFTAPLDGGFGPTELARDLGMSKSTCLAVLSTLTDAGYLMQHPTRRDYRLGPALVGAGRAALARFPDLSAAHAELASCAARLGVPINVATLADEQIVVIDSVGGHDPFGGYARVGSGVPFVPPFGAGFVAWADPSLWRRWLDRAWPTLEPDQVDALRASVEIAHRRGYLVSLELPADHESRALLDQLRYGDRGVDADQIRLLAHARVVEANYFLDDINPQHRYSVNLIQVPLLPSPSHNPITLMATPFGRYMAGADIAAAGERLIAASRAVVHVTGRS